MSDDLAPGMMPLTCSCGEHAFLPNEGLSTILVDAEKLEFLRHWNWVVELKAPGLRYAQAHVLGRYVFLHRVLANPSVKSVVDHINGDTLDNRSCNLRVCTHAENIANQGVRRNKASRFKGVFRSGRKWAFQAARGDKKIRKCGFDCEVEAARAYDQSAMVLFGKFARTNAMMGLLPGART